MWYNIAVITKIEMFKEKFYVEFYRWNKVDIYSDY